MKQIIGSLVFLSLLMGWLPGYAQKHVFADEIAAFKAQDKVKMPQRDAILFVGSSSFRKWEDMQTYFPDYRVINRGFGGSRLNDLIYYFDDVVLPYHPRQIVIYAGDNDAVGPNVDANVIVDRFKIFFELIRKHYPDVHVAYVSIKPSPSRKNFWPAMIAANEQIKYFLSTQKNAGFIDVFHPMLNTDGSAKTELFLSDMLHMNEKGYEIWKEAITPFLLK